MCATYALRHTWTSVRATSCNAVFDGQLGHRASLDEHHWMNILKASMASSHSREKPYFGPRRSTASENSSSSESGNCTRSPSPPRYNTITTSLHHHHHHLTRRTKSFGFTITTSSRTIPYHRHRLTRGAEVPVVCYTPLIKGSNSDGSEIESRVAATE